MVLKQSRLALILSFLFIAIGIIAAYQLQLADANAYMGYSRLAVSFSYLISVVLVLFVVGFLTPTSIEKPSDFFLFLYSIFILLPFGLLYNIRGPVEVSTFVVSFLVLLVPYVVVQTVCVAVLKLKIPALLNQRAIVVALVLMCLGGVYLAFSLRPDAAGFDLASSYQRRLQGREVYPAGSIVAYLNMAIVNGFAPFIAFVSGWKRRPLPLVFAFFIGLSYFYLIGLKAPIFFILLSFLIGHYVYKRKLGRIASGISFLLCVAFSVFYIEYAARGYSVVGDYFIRRVFVVPPWVLSAYFEFIELIPSTHWHWLYGLNKNEAVTFVIGEQVLGFEGMNANTNTFIYQLAAGGVSMYLFTIMLVVFLFYFVDSCFNCNNNPMLLYIGFSFSILIIEQAATTALVSSGIGILLMLAVFSSNAWRKKNV